MKIDFINTNYETMEDASLLSTWYGDPLIRHLAVIQNPKIPSSQIAQTAEALIEERKKQSIFPFVDQMILVGEKRVGHCTIMMDPSHRLTKTGRVAWLALAIGESQYRGKGIGKAAIKHLEWLSQGLHATHCEAGVFEFNEPSLRLFTSLGYEKIGHVENATYWKEKGWADIRFLKKMEPPCKA